MSLDCLVIALHFAPALTRADALAGVKRGVDLIGSYHGEPLAPADTQREGWEQDDADLLDGLLLNHDPLAFESGKRVWTTLVDHRAFHDDGLSILKMEAPIQPNDREGVSRTWTFALHAAVRLVTAMEPSFACVGGLESGGLPCWPRPGELPHLDLPAFFSPWVYLGGERLTEERRELLAALPCAATRPLGHGWVVQSVDKLVDQPGADFLDALATLPSWTSTGYRQADPEVE